jgi:hypothetical protein
MANRTQTSAYWTPNDRRRDPLLARIDALDAEIARLTLELDIARRDLALARGTNTAHGALSLADADATATCTDGKPHSDHGVPDIHGVRDL